MSLFRSIAWGAVSLLSVATTSALAESGNVTLQPNAFFNFDSGAVSATGGDVLWNGVTLVPQGRAELFNAGKYGSRAYSLISARHAAAAPYKSEPIPAGALTAGDVFGVLTNGGNHAKVLVTGGGNGSLALKYTTFGNVKSSATPGATVAAAPSGPTINLVQNNYSYIVPGLPNYGIAPGSIFVIVGTGLSSAAPPVLQSSAPPGLQTSLNQSSVSVTVNGVKTTPAIYYTSATQIAAVLPSTTPAGNGTVTVTYNGAVSNAAPIHVVANAPGIDTAYQAGNGLGLITDNNTGNVITLTNSATPGETIVLWGSGLGADTNNDDRTYPQNLDNLTSIPTQVFIGGVSAKIIYSGRSQYPGLDQYDVTVPSGVSPGCFVSVVVVANSVVSNSVTMPLNPSGGPCSDPASGLNGTMIQALASKSGGSVNTVTLSLVQQEGATAVAQLPTALPSAYFGGGYEYASQGSCTVVPPGQGEAPFLMGAPLSAGTIQATTPSTTVTLNGIETPLSGSTLAPGTYSFTASGGANIGSFKATVNVQTPVVINAPAALATITRSQGVTVSWSGGYPNGDVQIEVEDGGAFGDIRVYCHAATSAGQMVIPPSILMALPPGGGDIIVTNETAPVMFTATGLDIGVASATAIQKFDTVLK